MLLRGLRTLIRSEVYRAARTDIERLLQAREVEQGSKEAQFPFCSLTPATSCGECARNALSKAAELLSISTLAVVRKAQARGVQVGASAEDYAHSGLERPQSSEGPGGPAERAH